MAKKYVVRYSGHSVEMSRPSNTVLIYKIPYRDVKIRNYGFQIDNPFIVYILLGRNATGRDVVYVGKSKNGLSQRPTAHDDKYDRWSTCFILTQFNERTFFNDGTIQYLEDRLNKQINDLGTYENTTETTTSGTANKSDEEDCDDYLKEALDMLFILGLDLFITERSYKEEPVVIVDTATKTTGVVPDGTYYMKRRIKREGNVLVEATMRVEDGKYIVEQGSMVVPHDGPGLLESVREIRNNHEYVENGKLVRDVTFTSSSLAGSFVIGASCNGWTNWKTKDDVMIDMYRNKEEQPNG